MSTVSPSSACVSLVFNQGRPVAGRPSGRWERGTEHGGRQRGDAIEKVYA